MDHIKKCSEAIDSRIAGEELLNNDKPDPRLKLAQRVIADNKDEGISIVIKKGIYTIYCRYCAGLRATKRFKPLNLQVYNSTGSIDHCVRMHIQSKKHKKMKNEGSHGINTIESYGFDREDELDEACIKLDKFDDKDAARKCYGIRERETEDDSIYYKELRNYIQPVLYDNYNFFPIYGEIIYLNSQSDRRKRGSIVFDVQHRLEPLFRSKKCFKESDNDYTFPGFTCLECFKISMKDTQFNREIEKRKKGCNINRPIKFDQTDHTIMRLRRASSIVSIQNKMLWWDCSKRLSNDKDKPVDVSERPTNKRSSRKRTKEGSKNRRKSKKRRIESLATPSIHNSQKACAVEDLDCNDDLIRDSKGIRRSDGSREKCKKREARYSKEQLISYRKKGIKELKKMFTVDMIEVTAETSLVHDDWCAVRFGGGEDYYPGVIDRVNFDEGGTMISVDIMYDADVDEDGNMVVDYNGNHIKDYETNVPLHRLLLISEKKR